MTDPFAEPVPWPGALRTPCPDCASPLPWRLVANPIDPDDGPRWQADCCGRRWCMAVATVSIWEDAEGWIS